MESGAIHQFSVCPSCLAKPVTLFIIKISGGLPSLLSVECNCYLREYCPYCGKGSSNLNDLFSAYKYETFGDYLPPCGHCEKDISQCEPEPSPKYITIIQRKLNTYLELVDAKKSMVLISNDSF